MTDIKITKVPDGFFVEFPRALNTSFQEKFPSARWRGGVWRVGPRSRKRVEQWAAEIEAAAKAAVELEALELTHEEIESVRAEVDKVRAETEERIAELAALEVSMETLKISMETLNADKARLEAAQEALTDAKSAHDKEQAKVEALLKSVVDMDELNSAHKAMRDWHETRTGHARRQFNAAQERVCVQRDRLKDAGFSSKGIDALCSARFNRPDQDYAGYVKMRDILVVHEWEDEDE